MSEKFDYIVINASGHFLTVVRHLNGAILETDDIENVIDKIAQVEGVGSLYQPVVYMNSSGNWDIYIPLKKEFVLLDDNSLEGGIKTWLNMQND